MSANRSLRGFTLVEMLVVLGIIAVLVALLMPAVMSAVNNARRAAIGVDIKGISDAMESYKSKRGDYPPNFRDYPAFIRHVRKCFPKIDNAHLNTFVSGVWPGCDLSTPPSPGVVPMIDEGESLVFWLHLLDNDPRYPFKAGIVAFGLEPTIPSPQLADVLNAPKSAERQFPFREDRLIDGGDNDFLPSYRAIYSKDTFYIYCDSRSYDDLANFTDATTTANSLAFAEERTFGEVRPYWSENQATTSPVTYKPMNPTSFQVIGAGQDGLFGPDAGTVKYFPGGGGYTPDDRDNMTNFSEGRRLEDHIP